MNYFEKINIYLACTLCMLVATLCMNEATYSHDIPVPVDIQSSDGSEVVLVTHMDLYDKDGNFVAHIHDWATRRYTQEEANEVHANNPHTRQSVIDGLPKAGDVSGVTGRSYDNPGFSEPDNTDNIGGPDPDGEYENYGIVTLQDHLQDPNSQENSLSTQNEQGAQPSLQESQGTQPVVPNQVTATYNGAQESFEEVSEPESSDEELFVISEGTAIPASEITDPSEYSGTRWRLLSSSATGRTLSETHRLEIVGVIEVGPPRRLVMTLRNHTRSFINLAEGWSLLLLRPDGSSAAANMRSQGSLFITPQKARGEKYADTDIALLPRKSFRKLDGKERFFLSLQYFYGSQSGYKPGDVFILSYEGAEVSRYPEAMQLAPRLHRTLTTTWGSLKKSQ